MLRALKRRVDRWREEQGWPAAVRDEVRRDRAGLHEPDPGPAAAAAAGLAWLARAQDRSATNDGGFARHYGLLTGWGPSYPETSGYIVPTFLDEAARTGDAAWAARARRCLDWLVGLQFPEGGLPGGTVADRPQVPVTFNTGQILLGFAAGARAFGDPYREPMRRAAQWLADTMDPDGCWRRFGTPFAKPGEKAYETHVAWGLAEAERIEPGRGWGEAAARNVRWALGKQLPSGWLADCCLEDPRAPLTHTLGYALRGILEVYAVVPEPAFLDGARRLADGLAAALEPSGRLPGRLDSSWRAAVPWACLTGAVQIAHSWFILADLTGEPRYRALGRSANAWVRRTMALGGPEDMRGAVKGSFPADGGYCRLQAPNWAAKFMIDAQRAEERAG